jgi:tRNA 2-thiouridine synthesizing protein E
MYIEPIATLLDRVPRDEEGYLLSCDDWSPDLAEELAAESGQPLDRERRDIVRFIREYYERNDSVPEARRVLGYMKSAWGPEKATRRYLYRLFPRGYGQQACKIAGMRKPRKLMLDV